MNRYKLAALFSMDWQDKCSDNPFNIKEIEKQRKKRKNRKKRK